MEIYACVLNLVNGNVDCNIGICRLSKANVFLGSRRLILNQKFQFQIIIALIVFPILNYAKQEDMSTYWSEKSQIQLLWRCLSLISDAKDQLSFKLLFHQRPSVAPCCETVLKLIKFHLLCLNSWEHVEQVFNVSQSVLRCPYNPPFWKHG